MLLSCLGKERFEKILDVGCGSGILFPELSRRCNCLYAMDVHDRLDKVKVMADLEKIPVDLERCSIHGINFKDETFNCLVCVSVLEFIDDLKRAFSEMYRVTKKEGIVILGFPVINILTDLSYLLIGIKDARRLHKSTHRDILREAKNRFIVEKMITFPSLFPLDLALFVCCRLRKE
jgi:ubiquinone/menaquinone biosynthesis C-methylase UbiE